MNKCNRLDLSSICPTIWYCPNRLKHLTCKGRAWKIDKMNVSFRLYCRKTLYLQVESKFKLLCNVFNKLCDVIHKKAANTTTPSGILIRDSSTVNPPTRFTVRTCEAELARIQSDVDRKIHNNFGR